MSKKAKGKSDPEKIAIRQAELRREDFESVGLQVDAAALLTNEDVSVRQERRPNASEGVKGNVKGARRLDAFDALKDKMVPGAYDAVRRLARDITMARGEHDSGRPVQRVDGDEESARGRTDAMIDASRRVRKVLGRIGPRDGKLLAELISPSGPTLLRAASWRDIVQVVTGESHVHGQAAAVRGACANLAYAYQEIERERPKAA